MTPLDTLTLEASRCELLAALEREAYPSLRDLEVEGRMREMTWDEGRQMVERLSGNLVRKTKGQLATEDLLHTFGSRVSPAYDRNLPEFSEDCRPSSAFVRFKRRCPIPPRSRFTWRWEQLRNQVLTRDRGICAMCGKDTIALEMAVRLVQRKVELGRPGWDCIFAEFCWAIGFSVRTSPWQADHIVPRAKGGVDELENLRTLCLRCHHAETRRVFFPKAYKRSQR